MASMASTGTILLASDLTARSDRPTDRALILGKQIAAPVLLVHILGKDQEPERFEEAAENALKAAVGPSADDVEILVGRGEVHREILELAADRSASFIVTGVARFNNIRDYFLGTAVDQLVRNSPVPVLVVKQRAREPYRRLIVATDFSDCSRRALEKTAAIFPQAEITAWHCSHAAYEAFLNREGTEVEIQQQADRDMEKFMNSVELPQDAKDNISQVVEIGELHHQLHDMLLQGKFDLLVLGTHGRSGFAHATIGSRAAELLKHADCDVVMVGDSK